MKTFNIAFIGDPGVGKTAAIQSLKSVWYPSMKYVSTVGTEVHPMILTVDGEQVVVNIWDVGPKYPSPPEGCWKTKNIDVTCVFFDSSHMRSFQNAMERWMNHVCGIGFVVAMKMDLPTAKPQLLEFARLRTMIEPFKITATDPVGIKRMLVDIVRSL